MQEIKRVTASGRPSQRWGGLYRAFELFRKRKVLVIALLLILFTVLCGWQYVKSLCTARIIRSLDYE